MFDGGCEEVGSEDRAGGIVRRGSLGRHRTIDRDTRGP